MMQRPIRVTVWNEYRHERHDRKIAEIYPQGMHGAIADYLRQAGGFEVEQVAHRGPRIFLSSAKAARSRSRISSDTG